MMRPLSENARRVLEARYLARDAGGQLLEDWPGLCARVASAVAGAERAWGGSPGPWEEAFRQLLEARRFLPNSPTLMNAGTPLGQLAACFVLPVEDDLACIFESLKRMAVIHQSGGGTGFDFSRLRPRGDTVRRTHGVASGPVSFIGVFDAATRVVKQGGRRRGANMGVLRADHPDVLEFVRAKADPGQLSNFNLSLATPDAFWRAATSGGSWDLVHPVDGKVVRSLEARSLLDAAAREAWAGGDPGVIFMDAVERDNPTPQLGALHATNPCGELPLLANEACTLGSLRLDAYVRDGVLDEEALDADVDLAVRFLDDVIEVSRYPFPEIDAAVKRSRKIGLGVMGFADALVDVGVAYGSQRSVALAERWMGRIRARADAASAGLAEERGAFPAYAGSRLEAAGRRQRNATTTSIAPTGTLSILADCSSGIEPYFALAYVRHVLDGERLPEVHARFERALRQSGAWSAELLAEVRRRGSLAGIDAVPEDVRRLFPTAADLAPERHLAIQEAFQRQVDNAVSKTLNLPADTTPEDVRGVYESAWRRGLKGVTVFREGAKGQAVLVRGAAGEIEVQQERAGACPEDHCP
jgi:ribonucleoside-diphosphate reductase alpha chain